MGWRDKWYLGMMAAMRSLRGDGQVGTDGIRMPLLQASDGIAILGQISPAVVRVLKRQSENNGKLSGLAMRSDLLTPSGILNLSELGIGDIADAATPSGSIPIVDYVAGWGASGSAYKRSPVVNGPTFEMFQARDGIVGNDTAIIGFQRTMMASWQRGVDAAAAALSLVPDVRNPMDVGVAIAFFSAVRSLCADLDVLQDNPPPDRWEQIVGATRSAVDATEEFAGKAAANIAQEIGHASGLVAKGFFAEAGITSLMVAGIAVWLFLK
jgi:hypothetical protein